jgi:hypothetical protein
MTDGTEDLSEEEARDLVRRFQDDRESTASFFTKVVKSEDTTKTGFVTEEELGMSNHPIRTYKELELFCRDICEDESFADYFKSMAEIQLATSLSNKGFLLRLVGTQRKEIADLTPKRKRNKGMFKKKGAQSDDD